VAVAVTPDAQQGFFSLLRWRSDPTKDEGRNVAVLLVDEAGNLGGIKHAPLSAISSRLQDQGLMDAVLAGLEHRFNSADDRPNLENLGQIHRSLQQSLVLTEPRPLAVTDVDEALTALYRAYVAPRTGGGRAVTKGVVLDRVVAALRTRGYDVARGAYVNDFIFDAVIKRGTHRRAFEVLSFAAPRKNWTDVEKDAGHFLYAIGHVDVEPTAVLQPPPTRASDEATASYRRVRRWLKRDGVDLRDVEELKDQQLALI
jgi:hypothetical protein